MKAALDLPRHYAVSQLGQFEPYKGESGHPHAEMYSHAQMIEMFCAGFSCGGIFENEWWANRIMAIYQSESFHSIKESSNRNQAVFTALEDLVSRSNEILDLRRRQNMRDSSIRKALKKHGMSSKPTQSAIDEIDLATGKIR